MKKEKIIYLIIGILLLVGIIVGTSYAWWSSRATQKGVNEIKSSCLNITLTDQDEISLENAYPITDEMAESIKPYTFTITNTCNNDVDYLVNLEVMNTSNLLNSEYVATSFNGEEKKLLSAYKSEASNYKDEEYTGYKKYELASGELEAKGSVSYTLKIWMDEHVTIEDDAMNKTFISKVSVEAW